MYKRLFLSLLFLGISSTQVSAANYYVSPSGSDSNLGSSESVPWKTIQKAASAATAGDTVYVHAGTYIEQVSFAKSGTSTNRITFSASPGENPIIDGTTLGSIATDGLVQVKDGVNYITFNGFTIKGSPNMGLANRGSNNIFSNNKILLSYDSAIWHRFGTNTVFKNNEVYNNVRMFTLSASESSIVCSGSATWWPATLNSQNSTGALWEGNYVHNNCGEGIVAHNGDRVIGNTFKDNWSVNMYIDHGTGVVMDKNFVYDTDTSFVAWPGNGRNIPVGIAIADEEIPCNTSGNVISNNVVVNARFGVSFYPYVACSGMISTKIVHNTFINSWEYGIRIQGASALNAGSTIANNIFYSNRGKGLILENPTDTIIQNNLWYMPSNISSGHFTLGNSVYDFAGFNTISPTKISGNIWGDPQFAGTTPADQSLLKPSIFALKSNSIVIDKSNSSYATTSDFASISRPVGLLADLGAYEYSGAASSSVPTPTPMPWTTQAADYNTWLSHYLQSITGFINGDFSGDGIVDGIDYMVWVINYSR